MDKIITNSGIKINEEKEIYTFITMEKKSKLIDKLSELMNEYSIDTYLDIPDFIIGQMIYEIIESQLNLQRNIRLWKGEKNGKI